MSAEKHYFDLLPAYALGSLDEDEQFQVSEHLAVCTVCRAELQAFDLIIDDIPLAMTERNPSGALKDRILAHARGDEYTRISSQPRSWWVQLTQAVRIKAPTWGQVSLILILILGFSNLFLWGRLNRLESNSKNALITILMQGTDANPQAVGMLVVSQNGDHGTLIVDGLPILEETSSYQLWLIKDGQRSSGGLFNVDEDGYGSLWVASSKPLLSYSEFGITVEPTGGSPRPTGPKVLGGEV